MHRWKPTASLAPAYWQMVNSAILFRFDEYLIFSVLQWKGKIHLNKARTIHENERKSAKNIQDWPWFSDDVIISTLSFFRLSNCFFISNMFHVVSHFRKMCVMNHRTKREFVPLYHSTCIYSVVQSPCRWNILYNMDKCS